MKSTLIICPLISISSVMSQLIRDKLPQARTHKLSVVEKYAIANETIRAAALKRINTLKNHHEKLDNLLFEFNINPESISKLKEKIATERQALRDVEKLSPLQIFIPDEMEISFPEPKDGNLLWELDGTPPEIFREMNDLDFLITGKIVEVGEYYGILIQAWTNTGKKVLWEGVADNAEFADIAQATAQASLGVALGRPWSSLSITVEPPTGLISVNGELVGVGYWTDGTMTPGNINLEVSAQGYKPVIQEENLLEDDHLELLITLEEAETKQVLVRSIPPGASVRLGSVWMGLTPLPVTIADQIRSLSFELEGYRKRTVPFFPDTERLTVPLYEDAFDPFEEMKEARRRFDFVAALFSLSLAPTLILMGVSQNFLQQQNTSTSPTDIETANTAYLVSTGFMWGSVALNATLLTLSFINLGRFLRATEKLTD